MVWRLATLIRKGEKLVIILRNQVKSVCSWIFDLFFLFLLFYSFLCSSCSPFHSKYFLTFYLPVKVFKSRLKSNFPAKWWSFCTLISACYVLVSFVSKKIVGVQFLFILWCISATFKMIIETHSYFYASTVSGSAITTGTLWILTRFKSIFGHCIIKRRCHK